MRSGDIPTTLRFVLVALASAIVIADGAGCGASSTLNRAPSPGSTRQPCELLSPPVAKPFAGEDAQRQLSLDSTPPIPVGDHACFYKGGRRSVLFSIDALPADPDAPVNHFHVIRPENRIADLPYEAYWFAAGESLVVVKNGLLLGFKISDNPASPGAHGDQGRKADDIELADEIVPRVA
jgi:hypothetical protein